MYIYTIYKMIEDQRVVLEYVTHKGQETLAEVQERADTELEKLKERSSDPDSIKMKRRLVPGI
jgi:ElaB/YqjD/DUF883 family membrane-anchored ribosome-binding protein